MNFNFMISNIHEGKNLCFPEYQRIYKDPLNAEAGDIYANNV